MVEREKERDKGGPYAKNKQIINAQIRKKGEKKLFIEDAYFEIRLGFSHSVGPAI